MWPTAADADAGWISEEDWVDLNWCHSGQGALLAACKFKELKICFS